MRHRADVFLLLSTFALIAHLAASPAVAAPPPHGHIVETDPLTPQQQQAKFHLPPGFEIQLVASEPEILKPINIKFDARGRLWVSDTIEYPYAVKAGQKGRDTLKVLEIDAATGKATKATTFGDDLSIPIGVYPLSDRAAIVFSIPNIYLLTDTNGDGVADAREVLVGPFDQRDTHGLNNAFNRWVDGQIYACHGFSNDSHPKGKDGTQIHMQSGNTYRFRSDGTQLVHWTRGQVNPFGACFDAYGHLFTSDCHTFPAYDLIRGANYPSFGKPHDGLGYGPQIVNHLHGSTGIAGIVYYGAEAFPAEYRGNLFIGNPITHRVNRDVLERKGGTYNGIEKPDFLVCDDPWFRPVDLQLGPDGALYVADFYNRIIGHYEVPLNHPRRDRDRGRIWRIVYKGTAESPAPAATIPDLRQADLAGLVAQLGNANLSLATHATHELVDRFGADARVLVSALLTKADSSPSAQAHALWVLERTGGVSPELLAQFAAAADPLVRTHVMRIIAERPTDPPPSDATLQLARAALSDADGFVQRAAVDALGRHPVVANLPPLVALRNSVAGDDSHLVHTLKVALRDHLRVPGMWEAALAVSPFDPAKDWRYEVVEAVSTPEAAAGLWKILQSDAAPAEQQVRFLYFVARNLDEGQIEKLLASVVEAPAGLTLDRQARQVKALRQAEKERGANWSQKLSPWFEKVVLGLLAGNEFEVNFGVELAIDIRNPKFFDPIAPFAKSDSKFDRVRPYALTACAAIEGPASVPLLCEVIRQPKEPLPLRQKAVQILAGLKSEAAYSELLKILKVAPDALAVEIASGLASSRGGADQLLAAIAAGQASAWLLQDANVAGRLRVVGVPDIETKLKTLTAGLPQRDERMAARVKSRRELIALQTAPAAGADFNAGKQVFQKHCAGCHKVAGIGQKIGPELDGIGHRGLDRLLEDILDPSRNVDQAFRSTIVNTVDGRVITGLVLREEGNTLVMVDNVGKELRLSKDEIEERLPSPLSPMPANVFEIVPEADFVELVHFLMAQPKPAE